MTVKLSIVIKSDPQSVFQLFENPEILTISPCSHLTMEVKEKVEKASESSESRLTTE